MVEDKGDGDTEHGKQVSVVYCSVKRIDAPSRSRGDQVVFRSAFGVCFFANKAGSKMWLVKCLGI